MNVLRTLIDAGLHLRADGNRLLVAPSSRLTDPLRALIRQYKAELLEIARGKVGNPLMTVQQGNDCHAGGWDDAEIATFTARVVLFIRHGINASDADDLAERLILRDRDGDDRRLCVECRHGRSTRCPDGAPLPGAVLHRCSRFTP